MYTLDNQQFLDKLKKILEDQIFESNDNRYPCVVFDIDGNIINHECRETLGRLNNLVEFCLPIDDRADGLWDLLKKETS